MDVGVFVSCKAGEGRVIPPGLVETHACQADGRRGDLGRAHVHHAVVMQRSQGVLDRQFCGMGFQFGGGLEEAGVLEDQVEVGEGRREDHVEAEDLADRELKLLELVPLLFGVHVREGPEWGGAFNLLVLAREAQAGDGYVLKILPFHRTCTKIAVQDGDGNEEGFWSEGSRCIAADGSLNEVGDEVMAPLSSSVLVGSGDPPTVLVHIELGL